MSNEVNQAYLRAYIKNRVASSREREPSTPLPTRQVPTSQGGLESLYRRADVAREQIPAPRGSNTAGSQNAPKPTMARVANRDISESHPNDLQESAPQNFGRTPADRSVSNRNANAAASGASATTGRNALGLPANLVKPTAAHPASANPGQLNTPIEAREEQLSLSAHRPVTARSILGTRANPAHSASPATPSFATMPAVAARPAANVAPVLPRGHVNSSVANEAMRGDELRGEALPGTPVKPQPALQPKRGSNVEPSQSSIANEAPGVWSPLGAERGMKAAGVFRQQPAVVVNGNPYTVGPKATHPQDVNADALTGDHSSNYATEPKTQTIRIDSAHVPTNHLPSDRAPTDRVPTDRSYETNRSQDAESLVTKSPVARHAVPNGNAEQAWADVHGGATQVPAPSVHHAKRERTPEQFVRDKTRREIEERLVREERQATASAWKAASAESSVQQLAEQVAAEESAAPVTDFRPSWEVDRFFFPEVLYQLENSDKQAFELIGKHLVSANQDGLKVMAITSGERGVGRSTVAMHLARAAAAAGLNVALLDADTSYPSLIDQLRLDMDHGWQDSLFENIPLEEVAVRSVEDNLTVFPLTSVIAPQQLHANLARIAKFIKRISESHDIVFLDSHRLNLEQRDLVGVSPDCCVDAAVVVVDTELSIREKVDTAICILQGMGVASVGLVENFHA